jgi:hypothetical protein
MFVYGTDAGKGATVGNPYDSIFMGNSAGFNSDAATSTFMGSRAGYDATSANSSNFFGTSAGEIATNAGSSNFLGYTAGYGATNANGSNFFGYETGANATNAYSSNFFGTNAGTGATDAANSIFIGNSAGNGDTVNNTGSADDYSILLGQNTSTGGFSNSVAIGSGAVNTATNQFMVGSAIRPLDIQTNGLIISTGYTVATLPTGTAGARAHVTDAITPVALSAVVGGGAITVPVFHNGTTWIVG